MKVYNKLAEYYDEVFKIDYEKEAGVCHEVIKKLGGSAGKLLDVGCGTGGHMKAFKELGYEVEGLDSSNEMIRQARYKLPRAKFYKMKMQEVNLAGTYDVITLLSRTLLYLDDEKEIKVTLRRLQDHLEPMGLLVIDLDLHKDYFNPDKSSTNYFNDEGVEGSITEDYELKDNKVLWSVNLSIKKEDDVTRVVDNQEYLLINPKKLVKWMKEIHLIPTIYSSNGRKTSNYEQPLIIGAKNLTM
ncbi:methyltransferase domain-containing protein [archaeon]|nr:methyltransferase domain-containing protein [archaeon]